MLDKCDCCSHFAVSEKSLRPSGAEIKLSIVAYAPDRVGCKEQNENRDSINITLYANRYFRFSSAFDTAFLSHVL